MKKNLELFIFFRRKYLSSKKKKMTSSERKTFENNFSGNVVPELFLMKKKENTAMKSLKKIE
jgi:hypothetical protein